MTNSSSSSVSFTRMIRILFLYIILPILLGIIIQYNLYYTIETPPSNDYGTGSMFDQIATRYDIINRILAFNMDLSWRQRMVHIIIDRITTDIIPKTTTSDTNPTTTSDKYILDIATGTADVAILLAKEIEKRGYNNKNTNNNKKNQSNNNNITIHITGIDPSEQMISIGRQKIQKRKQQQLDDNKIITTNTNIDLYVHDAQELTNFYIPNNDKQNNNQQNNHNNHHRMQLYHAATMAFGIRNVPNRTKALCEIYNTLQYNSTLAILEFSEPEDTGIMSYIAGKIIIRYMIPFIGGILSGHPKEYWHLQHSIQNFPKPNDFINMIQQLHCTTTTRTPINSDDTTTTTTIANPAYQFDELIQMNFGTVQLYLFRTLPPSL